MVCKESKSLKGQMSRHTNKWVQEMLMENRHPRNIFESNMLVNSDRL